MRDARDPFDPQDADPIDVGAVNRDDAFIGDLAAGRAASVSDDAEYELAVLLTAWRTEALARPVPAEPTLEQIDAAVSVRRDDRGSLSRRLRIVSGAAAILAVVGAGIMVMSEGAEPGDPLWSVKQVVFAAQAHKTQARVNVEDNLAAAEVAIRSGDMVKARMLIDRAESELGPVGDAEEIAKLRDRISDLREDDRDKDRDRPATEPSVTEQTSVTSDSSESSSSSSSSSSAPSSSSSSSKPSSSRPSVPSPSASVSPSRPRPTSPASVDVPIG